MCNIHDPYTIQTESEAWSHCYECIRNDTSDVCSESGFNPYHEKVTQKTCGSGICAVSVLCIIFEASAKKKKKKKKEKKSGTTD